MNEFDSPNYAEFSYDVKNEGKVKTLRTLAVVGYIAFVALFFLFCYVSRIIPMFALAPILTWILIFFTWSMVKYDYYFEFKSGMLELGKVVSSKKGRKKLPKLNIHVKDALFIAPFDGDYAERLKEAAEVYDLSSSQSSDNRIMLLFENKGVKTAVIFEGTAKIANLLASFCPNTQDIKGKCSTANRKRESISLRSDLFSLFVCIILPLFFCFLRELRYISHTRLCRTWADGV